MNELEKILLRIEAIREDPEIFGDNLDEIAQDALVLSGVVKELLGHLLRRIERLEEQTKYLIQHQIGDPRDE